MSKNEIKPATWVKKHYISWAAREFIEHAAKHGEYAEKAYKTGMAGEKEESDRYVQKAQKELNRVNNVIEFMHGLGGDRIVSEVTAEIQRRIIPLKKSKRKKSL